MEECLRGMRAYLGNGKNPWYEIPNGSSALLAAAWLDAHGERTDVRRAASWVYDHETGPLQTGTWGGEEIDGLMMGWRGETREAAMASAYSMESLMPLQFVLPAVRYCPALADAAGKYARCLLSNFQLFRGRGTRPLYQTSNQEGSRVEHATMEESNMTNESTINKLIEMRLTTMADAFRVQTNDRSMSEISFDDRFGMLVDQEYQSRKNNRLKRLIHNADFEQPDAHIADIDYRSGRKLNKGLIERMARCEYITEYRNIFITGATGSGKTYLACAFGMEACKQYYSVKYVRLPDLLLDLQAAREAGTFKSALKRYTNPVLLILDEWLLIKLTEPEARDLFELIHKRRKKSSGMCWGSQTRCLTMLTIRRPDAAC